MKNGKRPTRAQKKVIQKRRFNPANWLVTKCLPDGKLHVVHRLSGQEKIISFGGG